ncbi:tyrosine-protein phosphatase [Parabacteroides sp. 52]|uniref:tyrosine-protein phosphatase n=1 Tax=unclassified Parabacteroides TaxID=2649774 RepID=UPI0013D17859|nr:MULTISPECIES: tyrosine-protein phosphatase [unclassified Parabacteroides]MDH6535432.1 protein tyrosine/serine phosphatase [Parabacteroides sp. PM5-20]NDV56075.1 tyrosine-protein phosphatase [Parabacteroides sp. 52]
MTTRILFLFIGMVAFVGCSSDAPDIHTLCLRDGIGNYVIKWETDPPLEGIVKIYASDNPEKFAKGEPAVYANIDQGIATYITNNNISRKYFRLTFKDKYHQVVGARFVPMDSVQNLRDLGGYYNTKHKMIRWGKVYRSGGLSGLSTLDSLRLSKLNIKTIIDLRSQREMTEAPLTFTGPTIVNIPVNSGDLTEIQPYLQEGRIRKGDAVVYMQDAYLKFLSTNKESFAEALELFLNKDNYPILFSCTLGKDATGFLAAMVLSALSVSEEIVMQDYMDSNNYIEKNRYASLAQDLNADAQEVITLLLSANQSFMHPLFQKIKKNKDYGSVEKYLATELNFSEKDREKLKDMLLY